MIRLMANHLQTSYAENKGNGMFELKALPPLAQVSPVNGIVPMDIDYDGNLDIVLTGNDYGNEVFSGRYDAGTGLILTGDGRNNFKPEASATSGFWTRGDTKALATLRCADNRTLLIATQNMDSLRVFAQTAARPAKVFIPQADESYAELLYENGQQEKIEFYYGSGYLSQSTRSMTLPTGVRKIIVYDFQGNTRTIQYNGLSFSETVHTAP
jgi:hypothetical protein